jgi:hypothetical protein
METSAWSDSNCRQVYFPTVGSEPRIDRLGRAIAVHTRNIQLLVQRAPQMGKALATQ